MNPALVLSHACDTHMREAVGGVWSVLIVCCDRPLRRQSRFSAASSWEDHGAGFHSAFMGGPGVLGGRLETVLQSQAQLRTRTGDPFLTMVVLPLLAQAQTTCKVCQNPCI